MHIDKFKKDKGYEDADGVEYDDATEFLTSAVLDFCSCGDPESAMVYVRDVLKLLDDRNIAMSEYYENHPGIPDSGATELWDHWKEKFTKVFHGNRGLEYFVYYFLDNKGFTEHGGSVPGWLTDKGREFIEDVTEFEKTQTA